MKTHAPLTTVPRRAVLIFADSAYTDQTRRAFPVTARALLALPKLDPKLSQNTDLHLFTSGFTSDAAGLRIHRQTGHTFSARLENAITKIEELGYEEIVVVGRDCPSLCARDMAQAFEDLASRKLVLGPDHRGGCYLIAFRLADRQLLRGIRWRQNTDCAELLRRCADSEVYLLTTKHDLDSWADVALFSRSGDPLSRLAAFLLASITNLSDAIAYFVDLAAQAIRIRLQMPPPAFVN